MRSSRANSLNTRSEFTMPICNTLNRSASCRIGRYNMKTYKMNCSRMPNVIRSTSTSCIPHHNNTPTLVADNISTNGKNTLNAHTDRMLASR